MKLIDCFSELLAYTVYVTRDGVSAGAKLGDADLIGIPYRIVVSKKTLTQDSVEVKKRDEAEAKLVKINELNF